jgi:hypothetical protein
MPAMSAMPAAPVMSAAPEKPRPDEAAVTPAPDAAQPFEAMAANIRRAPSRTPPRATFTLQRSE